jgi:5'-3' exonuclease
MGIPAYFRKITQKYPGCLSNSIQANTDALCFDFNCLIYRCLYSKSLPAWPTDGTDEEQDAWEALLLQEIVRIVKEIYKESGSPKRVYIAVDGVVPMAKIRQQRVRRFKSAWLKSKSGTTGWDSNAITPGTLFMQRLKTVLLELCSKHSGWELSSSYEVGEGEHKIMQWLRKETNLNVVVYGLDADLILLTALVSEEKNHTISLMRETQEFEKKGQDGYTFLHLTEFKQRLGVKGHIECINYIALMSLMGNDFLPHSLTHSLKNNGYEYVLQEFKRLKETKEWLVNEKGEINWRVLKSIFITLSSSEDEKMLEMINKKRDQARRGVLEGMDEQEGLPLKWDAERIFLESNAVLKSNWKEIYNEFVKGDACKEYYFGFQWIIDYYTGKDVDFQWMFPAWIPPLWSQLAHYDNTFLLDTGAKGEVQVNAHEQLAMVLPLESWGLVRDRQLRQLPVKAPQFWPIGFDFFSLGRKWLWECEAIIPPLTAARLRSILKEIN